MANTCAYFPNIIMREELLVLLCSSIIFSIYFLRRLCLRNKIKTLPREFLRFEATYIVITCLAMGADWIVSPLSQIALQPHFSNQQLGQFCMIQYASVGFFNILLPPLASKIGRKTLCKLYCCGFIICILILNYSRSITLQYIGRVLSGLSYMLLFTAFESWMIVRHTQLKLDPDLLSILYSHFGTTNSILAVIWGSISYFGASYTSSNFPYIFSIGLLVLSFLGITFLWTSEIESPSTSEILSSPPNDSSLNPLESPLTNYGAIPPILSTDLSTNTEYTTTTEKKESLWKDYITSTITTLKLLISVREIFIISLYQITFESANSLFLFYWTLLIISEKLNDDENRRNVQIVFVCIVLLQAVMTQLPKYLNFSSCTLNECGENESIAIEEGEGQKSTESSLTESTPPSPSSKFTNALYYPFLVSIICSISATVLSAYDRVSLVKIITVVVFAGMAGIHYSVFFNIRALILPAEHQINIVNWSTFPSMMLVCLCMTFIDLSKADSIRTYVTLSAGMAMCSIFFAICIIRLKKKVH